MAYIFLDKYACIYDTKYNLTRTSQEVFLKTGMTPKLLHKCIADKEILSYDDLCYSIQNRPNHYNLLDPKTILDPGPQDPCCPPTIHPLISLLFDTLCGGCKENIDWLHSAILHKYKNIDDVFMPCVIFHGTGGSGKNSFMNLLSAIFGDINTQIFDGKSLKSNFSTYTGKKIIVGYDEVESDGHKERRSILSFLKSIVFSPKITIEEKYQKRIQINNIAWFFLLSNAGMPLALDERDKGNRRFTIIRSGKKIGNFEGKRINDIVNLDQAESIGQKDKAIKIIKEYLHWLEVNYSDKAKERILALDNEEKRELEEKSESVGNLFFEWFEREYPKVRRLSVARFQELIWDYRRFMGDNTDEYDERYKPKYFDKDLSFRYKNTVFTTNSKTYRGYVINKEGTDLL